MDDPLTEFSPLFIEAVRAIGRLVAAAGDCEATLGVRAGLDGEPVVFASIEGPDGIAEFTIAPPRANCP